MLLNDLAVELLLLLSLQHADEHKLWPPVTPVPLLQPSLLPWMQRLVLLASALAVSCTPPFSAPLSVLPLVADLVRAS